MKTTKKLAISLMVRERAQRIQGFGLSVQVFLTVHKPFLSKIMFFKDFLSLKSWCFLKIPESSSRTENVNIL
jgi:hypothetical protein